MKPGKIVQYGATFTIGTALVLESVFAHDPLKHIETNEPQGPITFRVTPVIVTSNTTITTSAGSLGFG